LLARCMSHLFEDVDRCDQEYLQEREQLGIDTKHRDQCLQASSIASLR